MGFQSSLKLAHTFAPQKYWEVADGNGRITRVNAAAAAKSSQSCLTPSDPTDCSAPGSSIYGIFQAKVLEWGAIAFSH